MMVGSGGNLGLSREYRKELFLPVLFMVELSFNKMLVFSLSELVICV